MGLISASAGGECAVRGGYREASLELFIITILGMIRGNDVWISVVVYRGLVASETVGRRCPGGDSLSVAHAVLLRMKKTSN